MDPNNPPILNVNPGTGDDFDTGDHNYHNNNVDNGDTNTGDNNNQSTDIYDGYPPCFKMKGYAFMGWLPGVNSVIFLLSFAFFLIFCYIVPPQAKDLIGQFYFVTWILHICLLFCSGIGSALFTFWDKSIRRTWYVDGTASFILLILSIVITIQGIILLNYNKTYDIRNLKKYKEETDKKAKEIQSYVHICMIVMITIGVTTFVSTGIAFFNCYQSTEITRLQTYIRLPDHAELETAFGSAFHYR